MEQDQTAPIGAVCSGSMLFASIFNSSVMLGKLFAADDFSRRHFQMHFILGSLRVEALNFCIVLHHSVNKTTCTNTLPGYTRVYLGLLTIYFIIYWLNGERV